MHRILFRSIDARLAEKPGQIASPSRARVPFLTCLVLSLSLIAVMFASIARPAAAGDPEVLGIFALIDDADVRASLGLTVDDENQLAAFLDSREKAAAQFKAGLRALPLEDQGTKLAEFAKESERIGAQLINDEQIQTLRRWNFAVSGMVSLSDDFVAQQLSLTDEQRADVAKLLEKRKTEMNATQGLQRDLVKNRYEVELAKVLTTTQFSGWRIMTGDFPAVVPTSTSPSATPSGSENVALASHPLQEGQENESPADSSATGQDDPVEDPSTGEAPRPPATDEDAEEKTNTESPQDTESPQETESPQDDATGAEDLGDGNPGDGNPGDGDADEEDSSSDDAGSDETGAGEPEAQDDSATIDDEPSAVTSLATARDERKIKFTFGKTEWEPVIEWFAEQAGLSLQMDYAPEGTFNYQDEEGEYTISEGLDQINHVLLTRGFTLVRNRQMLMLVNLEDGIPEAVIETVDVDQLEKRGKYEVMRCVFDLQYVAVSDIEDQIQPIIEDDEEYGRFFSVNSADRIIVQSTGDKLRLVKNMLAAAEKKSEQLNRTIGIHNLEFVSPEEVMVVARPLLGIAPDAFDTQDGNLRIAVEGFGTRLFFQGTPENIALFEQIIDEVDVDYGDGDGTPDLPYLKAYEVRADPETVYSVLQTMLAGVADVRMQTDPATGNIILRARKAEHDVAQATIDEMQRRTIEIAVIQLRDYDPDTIILMVTRLLRLDVEGMENSGPSLDSDPIRNQLVVRGTPQQVAEIREFVEGLDPPRGAEGVVRENYRVIPLVGREATDAIEWAETVWETQGRASRLRIVMPEDRRKMIDERQVQPLEGRSEADGEANGEDTEDGDSEGSPSTGDPDTPPMIPSGEDRRAKADDTRALNETVSRESQTNAHRYVGFQPRVEETNGTQDDVPNRFRQNENQGQTRRFNQGDDQPDVIVRVMPYGIIIESDDLDALDDFEDLIYQRPIVDLPVLPTVFYLKNAKADEAKSLLDSMLGLAGDSGGGGFGNLFGGLASNVIGGSAGDLVGGLLGGGGGGGGGGLLGGSTSTALETTGPVDVVADIRLNALIVKANEIDLDLIAELLSYIDQAEAPQGPNTDGETRVIPVVYTNAQDIANIIQNQLADRIRSPQQGGGGQVSQERMQQQFLQQLLGGRGRGGGGGGGGGGGPDIEPAKFAMSVDPKSNSLLVTGPEFLYMQVKSIVEQLDRPEINASQSMSIIKIDGNVNPEVLRSALSNIFPNATTSGPAGSTGQTGQTQGGGVPGGGTTQRAGSAIEQSQRLQQFLQQRLQQGGGRPGGGTTQGGRPGGTGGRGGGGRGGR